jgi:hypothetical protein
MNLYDLLISRVLIMRRLTKTDNEKIYRKKQFQGQKTTLQWSEIYYRGGNRSGPIFSNVPHISEFNLRKITIIS